MVANPFLTESWFDRSVISIVEHIEDEGTTGVVLNIPTRTSLNEAVDGIKIEDQIRLYCGGPLSQDRLYFIHTLGADVINDARLVAPGLWIGGNFKSAIEYVNSGLPIEGFIRFFVGYSGWSPGQLAGEIATGTWALGNVPAETEKLLEGSGESYWHQAVRLLGPKYRPWLMVPHDTIKN